MRNYTSVIPYTEYTTMAYDTSRKPITNIIIHSIVGTVQSAINTFSSANAKTSAHYIIGNDGKLYAGLEEKYTSYHSGNYEINQASIGIEHEWYQGLAISDKLYATSAKLVADICKFYKLGVNRGVIKGHREIVPTACPNTIDVDRIVREAQAILSYQDPLQACLAAHKQAMDKVKELETKVTKLNSEVADLQATEKRLIEEKDLALSNKEEEIRKKLAEWEEKCQQTRINLLKTTLEEICQKLINNDL